MQHKTYITLALTNCDSTVWDQTPNSPENKPTRLIMWRGVFMSAAIDLDGFVDCKLLTETHMLLRAWFDEQL